VLSASVDTAGGTVGQIGPGLLVLFCAERGDGEDDARFYAEKIVKLRIFRDDAGKANLSVADIGGAVLAVSQFTLAADWRKGNRPSFATAEDPVPAKALYEHFCRALENTGVPVETGVFGAEMQISLVNDGPFTIVMT